MQAAGYMYNQSVSHTYASSRIRSFLGFCPV